MSEGVEGRRIGVTGATGFVGRAVVARLAAEGAQPVALCRRTAEIAGAVETRIVGEMDGGTAWVDALKGLDAIIHCAARVHVMADSAKDPLAEFRRVNRDGTLTLARACAAAGVGRLVFVSSIKVNGEATPFDPETEQSKPFTAEDLPDPQDPYGSSKAEAEAGLWQIAAETGLDVVVVRPVLVYGPGAGGNLDRLLRLLSRGIPLPLGRIDNRRSLIGVDNLADLLVRTAWHQRAGGQTFLASDGEDLSTPDLLRHLADALGRRAVLLPLPVPLLKMAGWLTGRSGEIDRLTGSLQVDSGPLRRELEWQAPETVIDGLEKMAKAFRSHLPGGAGRTE